MTVFRGSQNEELMKCRNSKSIGSTQMLKPVINAMSCIYTLLNTYFKKTYSVGAKIFNQLYKLWYEYDWKFQPVLFDLPTCFMCESARTLYVLRILYNIGCTVYNCRYILWNIHSLLFLDWNQRKEIHIQSWIYWKVYSLYGNWTAKSWNGGRIELLKFYYRFNAFLHLFYLGSKNTIWFICNRTF